MARNFAGADYVIGGIGGLVGIGSTGHSLWAVCRRAANGAWHTPLSIETSGNSSKLALQFSDTNRIQLIIGSSNKDTTVGITSSDNWVLAGVSRASGSSVPRGHKYVFDTNTWTHTDAAAATGGDSTDLTGGRIQIGRWQTTDFYNGDILLVGAAKRALADAEWEQLPFTLLASLGMAPDALWLLDQHATTQAVVDLTGLGANQTSLTNTSIASSSPPIWNYGAGARVSVGHAGGSQSAAAGTAAETDAAVAVGRRKTKTAGTATGTDSAIALGRAKARAVGTAAEVDTSVALGRRKIKAAGTAAETDSAIAVARAKARTVGTATETDAATAFGRAKAKAASTASSTESAQTLARTKVKALGTATETDAALPITTSGTHLVGRVDETDSAASLGRSKARAVATATALEAALPLARSKVRALGTAVEVDLALEVAAPQPPVVSRTPADGPRLSGLRPLDSTRGTPSPYRRR